MFFIKEIKKLSNILDLYEVKGGIEFLENEIIIYIVNYNVPLQRIYLQLKIIFFNFQLHYEIDKNFVKIILRRIYEN